MMFANDFVATRSAVKVIALLMMLALGSAVVAAQSGDEVAVGEVLDELHLAASEADFDRYFGLYADDFIFLGTDATERWDRAQFMEYARARFSSGQGWTYTMLDRHVYVSVDGSTAWFDERLDNANLGETRGSGVLVRQDGQWRVAQYHLTIPLPNEIAGDVVATIRQRTGGPAR